MKANNPKLIGITGGIATGKSTVSNIIKEAGYKLIDADKIAREVMEKGRPAYKKTIEAFGKEILEDEETIDRKKLGQIVFKDSLSRSKLDSIVHPYVFNQIKERIDEYGQEQKILFVDIPLLIEERKNLKKYNIHLDEIWLVYVDKSTQLDRLIKRDGISREEAIQKIKSQMPIQSKKEYASRIIDNRKDLKDLNQQMKKIMDKII